MFSRRKPEPQWQQELTKRVFDLERAQRTLADLVEELEDKLTRLRGVVYGRNLHKQPLQEAPEEPSERRSTETSPTDRMTREELKKHLARSGRFIPGKPPIHSE